MRGSEKKQRDGCFWQTIQGSAKEWSLGCVNPASWPPVGAEAHFTQPRDHFLADPCVVLLGIRAVCLTIADIFFCAVRISRATAVLSWLCEKCRHFLPVVPFSLPLEKFPAVRPSVDRPRVRDARPHDGRRRAAEGDHLSEYWSVARSVGRTHSMQ